MSRFTLLLALVSVFLTGGSAAISPAPHGSAPAQAVAPQASPAPSRDVDEPLRPLAFTETGHAAFPSLVLEPNGVMKMVYRYGSDHVESRDGAVMLAVSQDLGRTFNPPTVVKSAPGVDFRDPAFAFISGHLWTSWFTGSATNGAEGAWVQRDDREPVRIDRLPYAAITAPIRLLPDHTLGAVYYGHAAGEAHDSVWFAHSRDRGRSWTSTRIADGPAAGTDFQEPWLVLWRGQLLVTHRYGNWDGVGETSSQDGGFTWSTPRRMLDNATGRPNTYTLRSGIIAMSYRDATSHDAMLTLSPDGGLTWSAPTILLTAPPGDIGTTYADFVEVQRGVLFVLVGMQRIDESSFISSGLISVVR